jgi:hypothetical protein
MYLKLFDVDYGLETVELEGLRRIINCRERMTDTSAAGGICIKYVSGQ